MVWLITCFIAFLVFGVPFSTGYPSLDWYSNEGTLWQRWLLSTSSLHIVESCIMLFSYYIHRNFPKEFSLSKELTYNLAAGLTINHVIDFSNAFRNADNIPRCFLNLLYGDACIDIMRCILFLLIIYGTTLSSFNYFPLPFTWVFEDFSKFIFEPKCVRVFIRYLIEKEQEKKIIMEKLMKLYIIEFDRTRPSTLSGTASSKPSTSNKSGETGSANSLERESMGMYGTMYQNSIRVENSGDIVNRVQFLELMNELEPSFRRFKRTHSFVALYTMLKTFEDITEHAATGW